MLITGSENESGIPALEKSELEKLRGQKLGIPIALPPFNPDTDVPEAPDYAIAECWVSKPAHFSTDKKPVDVFWVYPTILSDSINYLMDIHNAGLREKAKWTIVGQASIFNGQANIYAPYYRQNNVNINPLMLTDARPVFEVGQQDLINAFSYFMENINRGERPIILAAHSQGSVRVVELSKAGEMLTGSPELLEKLVAAYVIGYSITPSDLEINPLIKISETPTQNGCFITYNTISDEEGKETEAPTIIKGTYVVNPLTWHTDESFAPASENIEAAFFRHTDPINPVRYPNFAAAQKKGNALVITHITNPEELPATSATFPRGVYHMYDYAIFYGNLKKNVADRIDAYLNQD